MRKKTTMIPIAAGLFALAAVVAPAHADMSRAQGFTRHDMGSHRAALSRDRADLQRLYRHGASHSAIARKRVEIRQDLRGIRMHRQEFRSGYTPFPRGPRYSAPRAHSRFGTYRRWHRQDHAAWRRGWDYRRGYRR